MYMIENVEVTKTVDIKTSFEHEIFANFISEDWVGFDVNKSIKLFANKEVQQENNTTASSALEVNKYILLFFFCQTAKITSLGTRYA